MLLDIVILPPKKLSKVLVKITEQAVDKAPTILVVDNKKRFHHVSLFHLRVSRDSIKKIVKALEAIAKSHRNLSLKFPKFQNDPLNPRYIWLAVFKTKPLYDLHKDIIVHTNKFRTGPMNLLSPVPSGLARKYVRQYGKIGVLRKFKPHFTLAKLRDVKDVSEVLRSLKNIKVEVAKGQILALAEVDQHWQVTRIIKKFNLGGSTSRNAELDSASHVARSFMSSSFEPINRHATAADPEINSGLRKTSMANAVKTLRQGWVVVYPTDTSYGLAVDATSLKAVKKLYQLKGRNFKKPVHVIAPVKYSHTTVYGSKWLSRIVRISSLAKRLMKKFWPGPLTIVLPLKAKGKSWQMLSAGTKTLGIRYPDNSTAQTLCEALKRPITTTSANLAGKPSCYSITAVKKQFAKSKIRPDFYLDGGKLPKRKSSTVVSLIDPTPSPSPRQGRGVLSRSKTFRAKILRVGPISEKQIKKAMK